MTTPQVVSLAVLLAVVAALISGRFRSEVVALSGAAVLLGSGALRPVEVQAAFASPAIIALASLFVICRAMELSGLLGVLIRAGVRGCSRLGAAGLWLMIALSGVASAFLNNTPIVVLGAPVVKDIAEQMGLSAKRFLIPLSYVTILGGACTLIGTSTNLLVNDMARSGGQPGFGVFEMTPVALVIGLVGAVYLFLFSGRLLSAGRTGESESPALGPADAELNDPRDDPGMYPADAPLRVGQAAASLLVFVGVVAAAALGLAPIAAAAFAGAVLLVAMRVITPEEAYQGLRPEILLLIAGMVVVGLSLEVTGLAAAATETLASGTRALGPLAALALIYGATLFLTEILSNAAVAVLLTPVAIALAESLGVSPRPFLVAVMMAASAAFATPFGYQTNVLVYQLGRYAYVDFLKIGLPLNVLTWAAGVAAIPYFFPF